MTKRIGLDMDGVIYNWFTNLRRTMCFEFGLDWRDCPHPTEWGVPWMTGEMWEWYYGHPKHIFFDGDPYAGAIDGVLDLCEIAEVSILTHGAPASKKWKRLWLASQGLEHREMHVFPTDGMKSSQICDIYIDDGLHNLEDLRVKRPNSRLILMDRPWNRHDSSFERVRGWKELVMSVEETIGGRLHG